MTILAFLSGLIIGALAYPAWHYLRHRHLYKSLIARAGGEQIVDYVIENAAWTTPTDLRREVDLEMERRERQ